MPIPTLPVVWIRIFSVLFVLNTKSTLSVVPRKLVVATVPMFQSVDHAHDTAASDTQLARPVASDANTLLSHGAPQVILTVPSISVLPQTDNPAPCMETTQVAPSLPKT